MAQYSHTSQHKDQRDERLLLRRQLKLPHQRQGQEQKRNVSDHVDGSRNPKELGRVNARGRNGEIPGSGDRHAVEDGGEHGREREEGHEDNADPDAEPKPRRDEDALVEEENGDFDQRVGCKVQDGVRKDQLGFPGQVSLVFGGLT